MTRRPDPPDGGFTLIELLVAVAIMAGAGVVLIGVMTNLIIATEHHRGYASVDVAARDYADAVSRTALYETTLTASITDTSTSLTVSDGSWFPTSSFRVSVEGEVITVTTRSGNTLSGLGRGTNGTTASAHSTGAAVARALPACPQTTDLTVPTAKFTNPSDVTSVAPTAVDWWVPTSVSAGSFTSTRATCTTYVTKLCPSYPTEDRPECDPGVTRLFVTAQGGNGVRNVKATEYVVVRRGNQ